MLGALDIVHNELRGLISDSNRAQKPATPTCVAGPSEVAEPASLMTRSIFVSSSKWRSSSTPELVPRSPKDVYNYPMLLSSRPDAHALQLVVPQSGQSCRCGLGGLKLHTISVSRVAAGVLLVAIEADLRPLIVFDALLIMPALLCMAMPTLIGVVVLKLLMYAARLDVRRTLGHSGARQNRRPNPAPSGVALVVARRVLQVAVLHGCVLHGLADVVFLAHGCVLAAISGSVRVDCCARSWLVSKSGETYTAWSCYPNASPTSESTCRINGDLTRRVKWCATSISFHFCCNWRFRGQTHE